ncbi:MAG: uroporphyrinogen decarboxylase [Anaerolineae bacterium]|nr:uroporphyrinogen decarboxylase [Anaerolineae bacterium]
MNHRDRLEATIRGEKPDRIAAALWRHWPGDDQDPADLAAAVLRFQRDYDFDFIKVTHSSSYCLEDWGVRTRWVGNQEGTREYTRHPIATADDWARLHVLDPNQGVLGEQLRCLSLVREGAEDTPFLPTIFSPLAQAKNLVGGDRLLVHLRQSPDALKAGLETITTTTIRFVRAARRTGIAGIFYAIQHASYGLLSEAEYREFGRPYDLRILEAAVEGGWFNLLHLHGINTMFDLVADYPVQAINWHDRETLPTMAQALGHTRAALCGGINGPETMLKGSPADVHTQVADAIRQTDGRRLIVATGCVIMITTPTANIRAAREAVNR